MYLPPVTPSQARAVYALLHVTPAMVRLDRLYDALYFGSTFFHLVARIAFLALGLSAAFRKQSDRLAGRILAIGVVRKIRNALQTALRWAERLGFPTIRPGKAWASWPLGQLISKFSSLWQPLLFRSTIIYFLFYSFFFTVFWSPLSYYENYVLQHRYGLSHQAFGAWIEDFVKDASVDAAIGAFFAALIIWIISIYPKRWALVLAAWSAPIILIGIFLDPFFSQIDNHFTDLPRSSALFAPLHQLAARAGVPNAEILVADKSKQTEETNAYVTGLGSSAQIVLWDTTIRRMKGDEVVAIVGHELGHYVEHHVVIGGLLASIAMFLFLPALKRFAELLLNWIGRHSKVTSLSDPAGLPILIISMSILSFVTSPITNEASRIIEHRADSFGLAVTGNRLAMARAMVDLANQNLEDPYPPKWEVVWLSDHPPMGERIAFALNGQPIYIPRK